MVKRNFEEQGLSMPDEAREVLFPKGVPVRMLKALPNAEPVEGQQGPTLPTVEAEAVFTEAEGGLLTRTPVSPAQMETL